MACEGDGLSTSMPSEDQNIDEKRIYEIALRHYRKHKVEISDAIKTTFPFLELLRDYGFITDEVYEESQESFRKRFSVQEVVYDVLSKMEKTFDLSILGALFNKVIMKRYPDLKHIYKSFKNVIPDRNFFLEINGEEREESPNIQLRLEQGTGENYRSLTWTDLDPSDYNGTPPTENGPPEHLSEAEQINAMRNDTTSGNNDALESQQANEQHAQESEPAELSSDDSAEPSDGDEPLETSTRKLTRPEVVPSGEEARAGSSQASAMMDTMNLGSPRRKRRIKQHPDESVNFRSEILPVTCGAIKGLLIKRKLERGAAVKSIRKDDGNWFTPREFEVAGGYDKASNWKQSLHCGGRTLKWLIQHELLPKPPNPCGRKKKVGNSDVCDICQDGGTLFRCSYCRRFFHEKCHVPPVDMQRIPWSCTFCRTQMFLGSQKCHRVSEVLARKMGPEEKLKCEFLLLKVYCHLERNFLKKIPQDTYIEVASQCLEELKTLNNIKKKLIEWDYSNVQKFVEDMHPIFESHMPSNKRNDSDLTEEEFTKNFKDIFGIQETN